MSAPTTSRYLLQAILDPDSRNANFFNGRILTADALQTEQEANRRQRERLGQALGAGVITGFEVELVDPGAADRYPVVSVSQGLALNPNGQLLTLAADITALELTRQLTPAAPPTGLFTECKPPKTEAAPPTDRGVYLLVAAPASAYEELAPKVDFIDSGKANGCDSRYATEGIQFRLAELKLEDLSGLSEDTRQALAALSAKDDPASLSKLRNWLAHVCFGTEELANFAKDPLATVDGRSRYLSYGAVDAMRAANRVDPDQGVSECELPLALLFWTKTGVRFLDMWSVRRRPGPSSANGPWPLNSGRRPAEVEAMARQFQDHIEYLRLKSANPSAIEASDFFAYLPPIGILPLQQAGGLAGFSAPKFFNGLTIHDAGAEPLFMEGSATLYLFNQALLLPPINTSSDELIWLLRVWENHIEEGANIAGSSRPYLIFTNGHLCFCDGGRFNLSHWSYGYFF